MFILQLIFSTFSIPVQARIKKHYRYFLLKYEKFYKIHKTCTQRSRDRIWGGVDICIVKYIISFNELNIRFK